MDVSIIVPVYNVRDYIGICLDSVINQTFSGTMECILVDDCTPDDSCEIIETKLKDYDGDIRFKLIHNARNLGLSAARNAGIREAEGDYVYFLDSDDSIVPECIATLFETLKKYPKADVVQAGTISDAGIFQNIENRKDIPDYSENRDWIVWRLLNYPDFIVTAWNKLVRRDFILRNHLFFKEGILHEDVHWLFFMSKVISSIAYCKVNTYRYVLRNDSIMGSEGVNTKIIDSWISIATDLIPAIDAVQKDEQVKLVFRRCLHPFISLKRTSHGRKKKIRQLLLSLSKTCSLRRKAIIFLVLMLPTFLNERKRIYFAIDNHF